MKIAGIGIATPPHRIEQADAAAIARAFADLPSDRARILEGLYRRAGVATRHSVLLTSSEGPISARQSFFGPTPPSTADRMGVYREKAGALAVDSSRKALADAGLGSERITHLVTVSCTGFHAPGIDIALSRELPLRDSIARTHVGFMGCQGALNGMRVAAAFTRSDPSACVLLCATELCSIHHSYGAEPEKIVADALFGDGSAAAVLTSVQPGESVVRLVASGSTLILDSTDAMTWTIGDRGFEMTLSPRVPDLISGTVRSWLGGWLAEHGRSIDEVESWAVHPGGPRVLSAFGEAMGLPRESLHVSYATLSAYGNMSSATILFILKSLMEGESKFPIVALAFGPGLSIEAALLEGS